MPKVSIIMPVYNAEKYIKESIDSILNQTFKDFELIVIDDGSSDHSSEIVKKYKDIRVHLYKNECNMGVANTLNKGLDIAVGEYIARMDSDDIAFPERLQKQVQYLEKYPEVVLLGTGIEMFGVQNGIRIYSTNCEQLRIDLLFFSCFAHPSIMMRASVLKYGSFRYDSSFDKMEDYDLWDRIAVNYSIASIPDILLRYRIHPGQVTQKNDNENIKQCISLKRRQLTRLGLTIESFGADQYIDYCIGKFKATKENIIRLYVFFEQVKQSNEDKGVYDINKLSETLHLLIKEQMKKLTTKEALEVARKCDFGFGYPFERITSSILAKVMDKAQLLNRRRKLKQKNFT